MPYGFISLFCMHIVSSSLFFLTYHLQINSGKNSHEYKQYHGCSCCSSEIMINKCSSVCICINNLCAVQRSTFGHQPDSVKTGHNTDQVQDCGNSQRFFDNRKCDPPETLPATGTIYFCTLIHIPGNSLQCSQLSLIHI